MFEKWIYLSIMHRVSKKTGERQRAIHYCDYGALDPIQSIRRYDGSNIAVLKPSRWVSTTDSYELLKAEADEFNRIFKEEAEAFNIEQTLKNAAEENRRKETLAQLR